MASKRNLSQQPHDEHDMSIEDILASIKKYVTDESPSEQSHAPFPELQVPQPLHSHQPMPSQKAAPEYPTTRPAPASVLELTPADSYHAYKDQKPAMSDISHTPPPTQPSPSAHPQVVVPPPQPSAIPTHQANGPVGGGAASPVSPNASQSHNGTLVSDKTLQTSAKSFERLFEATQSAPTTTETSVRKSLTLDQLISDLARPMVKDWLDKNLASFIEDIVTREVKKIIERSKK